jgi:hypothetical protein
VRLDTESLRSAAERFQLFGLGGEHWASALKALADITGSMAAHFIGLGANSAVPFNLAVGIGSDVLEEFAAVGGGAPRVNSRVRVGSNAAELEIYDESSFDTAGDIRRHPEYGDWVQRHDISHLALTTLVKDDDLLVGMAVMRNSRQGNIGSEAKRAFGALAPHARAAVRLQMLLQRQNVMMMANALDAVGATVFLCDGFGRVLAMSSAAERLVTEGTHLAVRSGHLHAVCRQDQAPLQAAIAESFAGLAGGRMSPTVVRNSEGRDPLLVEAAPVPRTNPFGVGVAALLIVRETNGDHGRIAEAARALFDLTPAEANVAAQLALGRTVATIAAAPRGSGGAGRPHV